MKKIAILFSGQGSNLSYIIEHLHNKELQVAVAITNNPQAPGIEIVKKAKLPYEVIDSKIYENREDFDIEIVRILKQYSPDLTVLAGFMHILGPIFTEQVYAINLHPSLLPRHKGLHAIEKSYADNYSTGGITVHWVSSELDNGEIILQKEIAKKGLDLDRYKQAIRQKEKEVLIDGIRIALSLT